MWPAHWAASHWERLGLYLNSVSTLRSPPSKLQALSREGSSGRSVIMNIWWKCNTLKAKKRGVNLFVPAQTLILFTKPKVKAAKSFLERTFHLLSKRDFWRSDTTVGWCSARQRWSWIFIDAIMALKCGPQSLVKNDLRFYGQIDRTEMVEKKYKIYIIHPLSLGLCHAQG